MITAATLRKATLFADPTHREVVQNLIFKLTSEYRMGLQAWAILTNHYHLIVACRDANVRLFLRHLHREVARELNAREAMPGRKVLYQFWDTRLTYESSWLARLHYVNQNPVKHGLVADASLYPWCSAAWFESQATRAFVATVKQFKIDRVNVPDDF